jgi:hypothetical protein
MQRRRPSHKLLPFSAHRIRGVEKHQAYDYFDYTTPPTAAMVDNLALGHNKSLCSSSRLGPTLRLSLTHFGIKSKVRVDLGPLSNSVPSSVESFWVSSCLNALRKY